MLTADFPYLTKFDRNDDAGEFRSSVRPALGRALRRIDHYNNIHAFEAVRVEIGGEIRAGWKFRSTKAVRDGIARTQCTDGESVAIYSGDISVYVLPATYTR